MGLRVVIGGGICVLLPDWTTLSLVSRASSRWRERMSGKENNMSDRNEIVSRVTAALEGKPAPVAIRNARKVDACGERRGYWVVSDAAGVIVAAGGGLRALLPHGGARPGRSQRGHRRRRPYSDPRLRGHPRARRMGEELRRRVGWHRCGAGRPRRARHHAPGALADHQSRGRDLPEHPHRPRQDGVRPPRHPRLSSGRSVPGSGPQGRT